MLFIGYLAFKRHTYSHSQEKIFKMTLDKNEITSKKNQTQTLSSQNYCSSIINTD